MGFKKRERLLILATIICVSLFFGDRLILTPLGRLWKERSVRIDELKKNLEKGEILKDRRDDLKARWEDIRESALPDDGALAEDRVLTQLHVWADRSGISLNSMKPRWREMREEANNLELRLTASGSLGAVTRFLFELENDPLPLRLEDVSITARDERGSSLDLSVKFSGLILKENGK